MIKKSINICFTIMLSFILITCSDDDNPVTPEEKTAKELSAQEITVPEALQSSQDPHAQMAKMWISLANSFSNYSAFYQPPEGSNNLNKTFIIDDDWSRTWESQGMVIKMDYFENATMFGWKIYISGNDGEHVFNEWLYLEAEQSIDESYGILKMYKPVTDEVGMEWNWTIDANGKYNFTLTMWNDNSSERIKISTNPDNSGELTSYNYNNGQFTPETKITWTAAGTGYYWEYDENGNVVDEGPF